LSDDAVIRRISTSFVPVALDHHKIANAKGETGDFYRSVYRQMLQYQGLWVVSPDGRALATAGRGSDDAASWPRTILADLKSGLTKFGAISPRRVTATNLVPYRGIGVRPDGSVRLAVEDRYLPEGGLPKGTSPRPVWLLWLGSVELSAAEWSALAPPATQEGSRWTIPEAVGRQFFPLLDSADPYFHNPGEVTQVGLVGRVASAKDGIARLVYEGHIAGSHEGSDAGRKGEVLSSELNMLGGVGVYDIRAGQMLSLTWVWQGARSWDTPPRRRLAIPFGTLVEWRRGDPSAAAPLELNAPGLESKVDLADSTPEDALKTFLLALAAQDEPALRAVTLPHAELGLLLKGTAAPPDQFAKMKAELEEKPMKRLKAGDPVRMPDGETRVIKPDDVREGRIVLWPDGAPVPSRLENVGGHWKVFAAPLIAARKSAEVSPR